MKIKTQRLILRPLKKGDEKNILENINNLKVSRYLAVVPYPYYMKDAKWFVNDCIKKSKDKKPKDIVFGIEFEKKIIGVIGLHKIDYFNQTASAGVWLGEKYWRKGIMSEALKAIINFAFNKLKLRRINTGAFVENTASNEMQKKFGFKFEGVKRKGQKSKATGKIHDENLYGLLKENWKNKK